MSSIHSTACTGPNKAEMEACSPWSMYACQPCLSGQCPVCAGTLERHKRGIINELRSALDEIWQLLDQEIRRWDDAGYEFPNADEIVPAMKRLEALLNQSDSNADGNARLYALAPTLLELLEQALVHNRNTLELTCNCGWVQNTRAAIEQATNGR